MVQQTTMYNLKKYQWNINYKQIISKSKQGPANHKLQSWRSRRTIGPATPNNWELSLLHSKLKTIDYTVKIAQLVRLASQKLNSISTILVKLLMIDNSHQSMSASSKKLLGQLAKRHSMRESNSKTWKLSKSWCRIRSMLKSCNSHRWG